MENNVAFPADTLFLVTGAAGFIGSNLTEALLNMGYRVIGLDNFSTGKKENLEGFKNNESFELIIGDIRDEDICQRACKGVDFVLHQAALGSVPRSVKDPHTSNEVNITGTLNMLLAARDNRVKRFVFASSSSVYGDDNNLPKLEDRVGDPLSPYAVTKKAVELYAKVFYELYGLETIGLRYFNVFGRRQDPDSEYAAVIPIFIKRILNKYPPVIYGDGTQSRDFTYIDNVIEANLKACLASKDACGSAYNIACGDGLTLIDLHNIICKLLFKEIKPVFEPARKGDIKHSNADITKAGLMLGYYPEVDAMEGLKRSVMWYTNMGEWENL